MQLAFTLSLAINLALMLTIFWLQEQLTKTQKNADENIANEERQPLT